MNPNEAKNSEANIEDGVAERSFEIEVAGETIHGLIWAPEGARGPRPLLLMGHGGGQHKGFPPMVAGARRYAATMRYAVVAIDAPGHGARATPETQARFAAPFRQPVEPGKGVGTRALEVMMEIALQAAPEWRAVLDHVQSFDFVGSAGPVGYLGVSMGAMNGIMLAADEPRITAAALGLAGLRDEIPQLAEAVGRLRAPVEFAMQWDDELVPRSAALALFDRIGSAQKTLHANPGKHAELPMFERAGWVQFFARHLGTGA
jgi:pimeloyl-ACP methyl ester carboxylesterase